MRSVDRRERLPRQSSAVQPASLQVPCPAGEGLLERTAVPAAGGGERQGDRRVTARRLLQPRHPGALAAVL